MSEINYFRACWAGSAYRNEQSIPENRWKRVAGKYLHEPVLLVSTRLVNVSQFRKQVLAGCPRGQTCFLSASTLFQCYGYETFLIQYNKLTVLAYLTAVEGDWREHFLELAVHRHSGAVPQGGEEGLQAAQEIVVQVHHQFLAYQTQVPAGQTQGKRS